MSNDNAYDPSGPLASSNFTVVNAPIINETFRGGTPALRWSTVAGVDAGKRLRFTTDGSNPFGPGPIVRAAEGFRNGELGNHWDYVHFDAPIPTPGGRDGGQCMSVWNDDTNQPRTFTTVFPPTTEFFMSYAVKFPKDTYFPTNLVSEPNTFPSVSESCLKLVWPMLGDDGDAGRNDLVLLSYNASVGGFSAVGNDFNLTQNIGGAPATWWRWDTWMTLSFWFKADPVNPDTAPGIFYFSCANGDGEIFEFSLTSEALFDTDRLGAEQAAIDRIKFMGWARGGSPGSEVILFDDIYVATDDTSAARVMLGDAPVWANCTDYTVCPTVHWDNTSIECDVELGGIAPNLKYAFIFDVNNTPQYVIPLTGEEHVVQGTPALQLIAFEGLTDGAACSLVTDGTHDFGNVFDVGVTMTVMVGNAPTYTASTESVLQELTAWKPTGVKFKLSKGTFPNLTGLYVFLLGPGFTEIVGHPL